MIGSPIVCDLPLGMSFYTDLYDHFELTIFRSTRLLLLLARSKTQQPLEGRLQTFGESTYVSSLNWKPSNDRRSEIFHGVSYNLRKEKHAIIAKCSVIEIPNLLICRKVISVNNSDDFLKKKRKLQLFIVILSLIQKRERRREISKKMYTNPFNRKHSTIRQVLDRLLDPTRKPIRRSESVSSSGSSTSKSSNRSWNESNHSHRGILQWGRK
ncbi:hypothetical protein HZH66_013216 [Vespula vulgaris]|uniref:Uncharacterized protein n=1 Tax=Vespula vulgaris TaxID=7454 RepID=A0A834J9B7_VESVU|nr:hypothetical protein HZH66_013216 [Vespula vulgaris]